MNSDRTGCLNDEIHALASPLSSPSREAESVRHLRHTHTHTYVTLEISAVGYDEIARKLRAADYGHCFNSTGEIDMTGIALVRKPEAKSEPWQYLDGSESPFEKHAAAVEKSKSELAEVPSEAKS